VTELGALTLPLLSVTVKLNVRVAGAVAETVKYAIAVFAPLRVWEGPEV